MCSEVVQVFGISQNDTFDAHLVIAKGKMEIPASTKFAGAERCFQWMISLELETGLWIWNFVLNTSLVELKYPHCHSLS